MVGLGGLEAELGEDARRAGAGARGPGAVLDDLDGQRHPDHTCGRKQDNQKPRSHAASEASPSTAGNSNGRVCTGSSTDPHQRMMSDPVARSNDGPSEDRRST
jgi:hypothetical protein